MIRLSPLVAAIVLATLWLAGTPSVVPDFRLSAPVVARPGSSIGLRAWYVDRDPDGRSVIRAPEVDVELRDANGLTIAQTALRASRVHGAEGRLEIPRELAGEHALLARATIGGREVMAERTLYVREGIDSRLPAGRAVNAFQVYELEPLQVLDRTRAPGVLDPRVEEGACVPDLRCSLVVWVGRWQGRLRLRPLAGVRTDGAAARTARGFARLSLLVSSQEGRVAVDALAEDGTLVASRSVRLPVVQGGLIARASAAGRSIELRWEMLGEPRSVLVDVFERRRWIDALSLAPGAGSFDAPSSGVLRIQTRADLFSDDTAGVTYVVATRPTGPPPHRQAAEAVLSDAERDGLDPLALSIVDGSFDGSPEDAMRALFAVPSFDVIAIGPGVTSRIGVDEAFDREQEARRWIAAAVILLIGLVVSMVLLRVEVAAQARAHYLLESLTDDGEPTVRRPSFGRGLWAFVLLVFVLMAVLALSKGWF